MRTAIAAALFLTATTALAYGPGYGRGPGSGPGAGYGPGGCMGYAAGAQATVAPGCEGAGANFAARDKMRAEMFELRRLAAQGASAEAYSEQLKKVDQARQEMWAARGDAAECPGRYPQNSRQ